MEKDGEAGDGIARKQGRGVKTRKQGKVGRKGER